MDDAAWAALTLSLTVLGGIWTWLSFRRRGAVSAMRALGFTLLPLAAYLTKTLQMFTKIVDAIATWATHLVLSPVVWLGVLLGGAGIALIAGSGVLRARGVARRPAKDAPAPALGTPGRGALPPAGVDPEMAEIEAILRKRGIS